MPDHSGNPLGSAAIYACVGFRMEAFANGSIVVSLQVPQQKNDYDCGLFVLYFMERFIEEAPARLKKKDLAMVPCPSIKLFALL